MTQTVSTGTRFDSGRPFPYVLMYHSVSVYARDPYLVTVDPQRFERQLSWLRWSGLRGVSMRELMSARQTGDDRGLVGLTFDDGYADFVLNALLNFRTRDRLLLRFARFYAVGLAGLVLTFLLLQLGAALGLDPNLVKAAAIPLVVLLQYLINRRWSFG